MIEIYYIEDDQNIAAVVKDYLEQKGYQVSVYATIAGAKEALRKHVPGLVLVDWNMPDGQGDALCRFIRSNWNDLPLIFLTVRDDSRDCLLYTSFCPIFK